MPHMPRPIETTPEGQIEMLPGQTRASNVSVERRGYVDGLLDELHEMLHKHVELVRLRSEMEGRVELSERNIQATRDYLITLLRNTNEGVPDNWEEVLSQVRYLGARLGEACIEIVRQHERGITTEEIESILNGGQFRFRTGTPLREINAALNRQPSVKRRANKWHYHGRRSAEVGMPAAVRERGD